MGHLLGYLILAYVVVYFAAFKGVKSVGKINYVFATFPYILLFGLFCKGLTLDGCGSGVTALFQVNDDESKVFKPKTWKIAFT